ncbi:MAG TPA: FHA domain-containing protein [Streptosporangiaceae bacterium]|nr:FHA domain-containing protein [Streptosporangiaceae bacterium]
MTEHGEAMRRPARPPMPRRSRRRWTVAAIIVACWVVLWMITSSVFGATILLVVIAALGAAAVFGLRALGVTRDHPWAQRVAARPWRDGQDVLQLALRHLSEVFVVTPSGALLAPNIIDLRMNPEDLHALAERMEPALVMESAAEVYEEQVAQQGARFARPGRAEVRIFADDSIPPGRYRLRQGQPVNGAHPYAGSGPEPMPYAAPDPLAGPPMAGAHQVDSRIRGAELPGRHPSGPEPDDAQLARVIPHPAYAGPEPADGGPGYKDQRYGSDGNTRAHAEPDPAVTSGFGGATVMERSHAHVPALRLVTGSSVAETRMSGARAGRGAVELALPNVPTVSREHARFTFSGGQWWVTNLGMNGLTVNGQSVEGEHPLGDGDAIRWGRRPEALLSQVEIG